MKYKIGDIVRVKDHKFFTDEAIQSPGTLPIEESIELKNRLKQERIRGYNQYGEKHDPNNIFDGVHEFARIWSVRDPETNDIDTEFLMDMLYYCNKEAIILDIKYTDNEGSNITNELDIEDVEIEDGYYYVLSIDNTGNMWDDWMLELVKER